MRSTKWFTLASGASAALFLCGCESTSPPGGAEVPASSTPSAKGSAAPPTSAEGPAGPSPVAPAAPKPPTGGAGLIAASNNAFAIDLWAAVRGRNADNLVVSPVSLTTALAMTWAGARGDTAAEMARTLHFTGEQEAVVAGAGELVTALGEVAQLGSKMRLANRLYGEKTYRFEAPFVAQTRDVFGAPLEGVDFRRGADAARKAINGWVSQQTNDRVKELIPSGGVNADTSLVLVNTIYFLGDWLSPFQASRTSPEPFWSTAAASKSVPMMHQTGHFALAAGGGVKVLELSYADERIAMDIILPDARDGLAAVEKGLTSAALGAWIAGLKSQSVAVSLPKFTIDPAASLSLGDVLAGMGMKLAFDRRLADFTGIADPPSPDDRLFIAKVFHKAFVKVDEKGTEAAAATAISMERMGSAAMPAPPIEFRADHPFLFVLRDTQTQAILFMGRVVTPG